MHIPISIGTGAFTVWEGFKYQGCMSCSHNVWYHPYFHQHSSLSHCHHSPFPSMECLSKLFRNVMEHLPIKKSTTNAIIHRCCTLSGEWGQHWNFFNSCLYASKFYMVHKTHAFTVWEGFKAQGCMSCPHNLWDHPCFHQRSSCSLIIIIHHSHEGNLCWNSFEMSWNIFQL